MMEEALLLLSIMGDEGSQMDPAATTGSSTSSRPSPNSVCSLLQQQPQQQLSGGGRIHADAHGGTGMCSDVTKNAGQLLNKDSYESLPMASNCTGDSMDTIIHGEPIETNNDEITNGRTLSSHAHVAVPSMKLLLPAEKNSISIHPDDFQDLYNQWAAMLGGTNGAHPRGSTTYPSITRREGDYKEKLQQSEFIKSENDHLLLGAATAAVDDTIFGDETEINTHHHHHRHHHHRDTETHIEQPHLADRCQTYHTMTSDHDAVMNVGNESSSRYASLESLQHNSTTATTTTTAAAAAATTVVTSFDERDMLAKAAPTTAATTTATALLPLEVDNNIDILKNRLDAVLEGAMQSGFGDFNLETTGRRRSTGCILKRNEDHAFHKNLNPLMSALLEPLLAIDEGSMEWRNLILQDFEERQKVLDADKSLQHVEFFVHPLHQAEDPQEQRQRLFPCSDDDVSVMTSDSAASKWSLGSTYANWFGTRTGNRRTGGMKRGTRSGRRFIDLTANVIYDDLDDDNVSEGDDDQEEDDSLGKVDENATLYSIPVQKCLEPKEPDDERSEARQFLDLTSEVDYHDQQQQQQHLEEPGHGKRAAFAWMGRQGSMSSIFISRADLSSKAINVSMRNKAPLDDFDDSASESSEDDDPHTLTPWEAADAAFIDSVHEIASNLERKLNQKGFESPYWSTDEIIPPFEGLHQKIKNTIKTKKVSEPAPSGSASKKNADQPASTISGSKVSRVSLRLSSKIGDIVGRRSLPTPIQHDSTGGYDDLGMRTLHRDDDAYLKNFLYKYRPDGFCTLPLVLANGLEKRLEPETVGVALDILHKLTSPLRRRNQSSMPAVSEEDDDEMLGDASDKSGDHMAKGSNGDLPLLILADMDTQDDC